MKIYFSLLILILLTLVSISSCDHNTEEGSNCSQITLNTPFTAKIGETWCIPHTEWEITFGPFVEDSRCNVPGIECVWAGRYVMAATIDNGEATRDTFYAVDNWSDTLYSGPYSIILKTVFPEERPTTDPLDPSKYAFDMLVK